MMGSTEKMWEDEEMGLLVLSGPGKPCLRGALVEMMMLYVIAATERVMKTV